MILHNTIYLSVFVVNVYFWTITLSTLYGHIMILLLFYVCLSDYIRNSF